MHTKHTPGPWACPHGARIYGADSHLVAETAFEHRGTTETEANAALMAAAPEMLSALIAILDDASSTHPKFTLDYKVKQCAGIARAAIARATGAAQ